MSGWHCTWWGREFIGQWRLSRHKHVKSLTFKVKNFKSSSDIFPLSLLSVPSPSLDKDAPSWREGRRLETKKRKTVTGLRAESPLWANSQVMSQAMGRASKTDPWIKCTSWESQSWSRRCYSVLIFGPHSPGHMGIVVLPLPQRAPWFWDFANKLLMLVAWVISVFKHLIAGASLSSLLLILCLDEWANTWKTDMWRVFWTSHGFYLSKEWHFVDLSDLFLQHNLPCPQ